MTLTACQKDEGLVSDGATSQTITVTIPQGMQTRATAADFGNGAKIDRCLLQIYHSGTSEVWRTTVRHRAERRRW